MSNSKLNPSLEPLRRFLGAWECVETYHAGGWTPKEVKAQGHDDIVAGPGGNSIVANYRSQSSMGEYQAHAVMAWDEADKAFKLFFFDSFSPGPQVQSGRLDGDKVVFASPTVVEGRKATLRRTYSFPQGAQHLVVEAVFEDGSTKPFVTINKKLGRASQ